MYKIILLCISLLLIAQVCNSAEVSLSDSTTSHLKVSVTGAVGTLYFKVSGAPIKSVTCLDSNRLADYNIVTNQIIVYPFNSITAQTSITQGEILDIEFNVNYGSFTINVTETEGASTDLQLVSVTTGGDGSIAILFQKADIMATASTMVGKSVPVGSVGKVIDVNKDGKINTLDVQILANNVV